MAFDKVNRYGTQPYIFGIKDSDAPVVVGFKARQAELTWEPEVMVAATDGEGHVDEIVESKPDKRKITGTFTGYAIEGSWNPNSLPANFDWTIPNGGPTRTFFIRRIGEPRRKGDFMEVTLEVESFAGVSGTTV